MNRLLLILFVFFALNGCVSTKVALIDDSVLANKNLHIVVVADEVDDPVNVGTYMVEEFNRNEISSELGTGKKEINQGGSGSGFVIAEGYWLTNYHVIKDLESITISVVGKDIPALVLAKDEHFDLALLKGDTTGLKPIKLGTAQIGNAIFVVGYPLPSLLGAKARITSGVVSSLSGMEGDTSNIQISAPIQPGNSGGPVVGENWDLQGVVVSTASTVATTLRTGTLPQGLNFAISPNIVHGWLVENQVNVGQIHATTMSEVVASTGLVWNGDAEKTKRVLIAEVAYSYYWDFGDHLRKLRVNLYDAITGELILKSVTEADSAGVKNPSKSAVREILTKLGKTVKPAPQSPAPQY